MIGGRPTGTQKCNGGSGASGGAGGTGERAAVLVPAYLLRGSSKVIWNGKNRRNAGS